MIALPSIAFGGFSGSAKGVTARQVDGRSILSLKCYPTGMATGVQLARRASLKMISKSWKELTNAQRLDWDHLAESATGKSVFGQKAKLSGMNLYVRLNSNLIMAGGSIRANAPIGLDDVPNVRIGAMYVNEDLVCIENIDEPDSDLRLVVKMSDAQSNGVSNAWGRTVIVSSDEETDWGELDLTQAFADVLGTDIVDGMKYFVELYWIDSLTGFSGPVMQLSGIAGPDPIYGSSSGSNRAIIRVPDHENTDRCYYKNFEYELSHGSVISTVSGIYGYKGTSTNSYVELDDATAAKFEPAVGYYLGRSNYGSNWRISYLEIETRVTSDKFRLGVVPHNDSNSYGCEIFDTGTPVNF